MKTNNQKFAIAIYVLFALILSSPSLKSNAFAVLSSTQKLLHVRINTGFSNFETLNINGDNYLMPVFSEATPIVNDKTQGAPAEFRLRQVFNVPGPNNFRVLDFKILKSTKRSGLIVPNPQLSTTELSYLPDLDKYSNYRSKQPLEVSYKGIAAGSHLADIWLNPVQYDYNSKLIEIIESAELTIVFDSVPVSNSNSMVINSNLYSSINSSVAAGWTDNRVTSKIINNDKQDIFQSSQEVWAKLSVNKEGAYYLDAADFAKLGINLTPELINTIKIYGYGGKPLDESPINEQFQALNEQAIIVKTNIDGSLNKVIFYASATSGIKHNGTSNNNYIEKYNNPYSFSSTYLLSYGGTTAGKRATAKDLSNLQIINRPSTYKHFVYAEDEIENPYSDGSGRQWMGKNAFPLTITNQLYNADRSTEVEYSIMLAHRLASTNEKDQNNNLINYYGNFKISENNNTLNSLTLPSFNTSEDVLIRKLYSTSLNADKIASDDRSVLKIDYSTSRKGIYGVPYLDYYIIGYNRSFAAINNELSFIVSPKTLGPTEFTITNFDNNEIFAWDITDSKQPIFVNNYSTTGSIGIFRAEPSDSAQNSFFVSSKLNKPNIERINFPNLRADADSPMILVITNPNLKSSADEYAKYRNSRSANSAKVYLTTDIYTEFGAGMPDPSAIRNFIQYKYHNSAKTPKFVLLWGDAHYDFRNIATKTAVMVPTWESPDNDDSFSVTGSYCTDDFYTWVHGNDKIADIAIGRIPANSDAIALDMLDKIKRYENESSSDDWKTRITFLADDTFKNNGEVESSDHVSQSEGVANAANLSNFQINKIYMPWYPFENSASGKRKPKVTEDLISTVNTSGTLILSYIGHGNPRVLAHEEVFDRDKTMPLFRNFDKLFFAFAATCDFGRFDLADVNSGAEELVKYKLGGAIAMLTPSRSVYIHMNRTFSFQFFENLMTRNHDNSYKTIGEAIIAHKASSSTTSDANDEKYILLGDPSIKLHLPESNVLIEEINEINLTKSTDTLNLKGLSKVQVKGKILNIDSTLNSNFNGNAIISLIDASEPIQIRESSNFTSSMLKIGNSLSKSSAQIVNGTFTAEFVIPKDISYSEQLAKMVIFAISNNTNETAIGSTNRIRVSGIEDTAEIEDNGPQIQIFLDSRNFRSGDMVSSTPLLILELTDETGINTAGSGIGHRIEAWIDDKSESIDLTNLYRSSFTNPKSGTIEKVLYDIPEGIHSIKIRAWDVFNNPTTAYNDFKIGAENSVMVLSTFMNPNPIIDQGNISITHTASTSYDIEISIFDQAGSLIRTLNSIGSTLNNIISEWDGRDSEGKQLAIGTYFYSVKLHTKDASALGYGKFVVLR